VLLDWYRRCVAYYEDKEAGTVVAMSLAAVLQCDIDQTDHYIHDQSAQ
jgi:hypothetical protein